MTHHPKIRDLATQIEALSPDERLELLRVVPPGFFWHLSILSRPTETVLVEQSRALEFFLVV